jgi:hypothetical protein
MHAHVCVSVHYCICVVVGRYGSVCACTGGSRPPLCLRVSLRDVDHVLAAGALKEFNLAEYEAVDTAKQLQPMLGALECNTVRGASVHLHTHTHLRTYTEVQARAH